MDIIKAIIKEPRVGDARAYARRIRQLALIYSGMFVVSILGLVLLVWQGRLYVTLTQRSNVETLTLAFLLIFFAYLALLSRTGTVGACRIAWHALKAPRDRIERERRKMASLDPPRRDLPQAAAFNVALERDGRPLAAFQLAIEDGAGSLGTLVIDGARIEHHRARGNVSNNLFAFFAEQVRLVVEHRTGRPVNFDVVAWKSIDDEAAEVYLSQTKFAANLAKALGCEELWPRLSLTHEDCAELERRLTAICPALRDEAMLPDWEYSGEHKVPIVPEPLGLVSITRSEGRVDPLTSMGAAFFVELVVLALFVAIALHPPWVPGT